MPEHQQTQKSTESKTASQRQAIPRIPTPVSHPMAIIQRARINPKSLTHADVMQLQSTIGNRAVVRLLTEIGAIPSKAKQAPPVQRQELVQRQEIPEEEEPLQGKMAETVQRQEIPEEEEPLQGKMKTVQRQEIPEEEEPLQGKFENKPEIACPSCFTAPVVQRQEIPEEEEPLQGKFETVQRQEIPEKEEPLQTKRENNTRMPDNLKAGVESLSGIDMSDVKVHYNSSKPPEVGALAYTQGTAIHIAPGQESHLPHEAWHVVQQKHGRVQATMQTQGMSMNDDVALEREADEMGKIASQSSLFNKKESFNHKKSQSKLHIKQVAQLSKIANLASGTDPETLISPLKQGDQVDNVDTGHMAISDHLVSHLDCPSWETFIRAFMSSLPVQYPKDTTTEELKKKWLEKIIKDRATAASYLKRYMNLKPGHKGAKALYEMLDDEDKSQVAIYLQGLKDFKLGDSGRLRDETKSGEKYDEIYIINAFGFDPLGDKDQVNNLASAIKFGGILHIIAEATGQSIQAFWPKIPKEKFRDRQYLDQFILKNGRESISELPIGTYFDLADYDIATTTKDALSEIPRVTPPSSTRHTAAGTDKPEMADNITITLTLRRNFYGIS